MNMVNVTVSVSEEMKKKMEKFAIINWSEVAREAFSEQISKMEILWAITSKSKAKEKDIEALAKKIKTAVWKRHEEKK